MFHRHMPAVSQTAPDKMRARHGDKIERRAAAVQAFWSDAPLNLSMRAERGDKPFSLREFIAFVEAMPGDQFEACTAREVLR